METANNLDARKVFFMFHLPESENKIIKRIVFNEYQAYSIPNDYKSYIPVIRKYPNSIVFSLGSNCPRNVNWEQVYKSLNPDTCDGLKISTWFYSRGHLRINRDLSNFDAPVDAIPLDQGLESLVPHILKVLESLDARGRRKYIRTRCNDGYSATFSIKLNKNIYNGAIYDISSFGMACAFNSDIGVSIQTYIHDIQIRLNGIGSGVSGIVSGKRVIGSEWVYVIVFDYKDNPGTRIRIQEFIYYELQKELRKDIKS